MRICIATTTYGQASTAIRSGMSTFTYKVVVGIVITGVVGSGMRIEPAAVT